MDLNFDIIPENFRDRRLAIGLSKMDCAQRIGVTYACLFSWENGSHKPREQYRNKIVKVLNTTLDYLTGKTTNPDIPTATSTLSQPISKPSETTSPLPDVINIPMFKLSTIAINPITNKLTADVIGWWPISKRYFGAFDSFNVPFIIYVPDDALKEIGIAHNSLVVVNPKEHVNDGDIVLFKHKESTPIVRICNIRDSHAIMRSSNIIYATISTAMSDIKIIGKVMFIMNFPKLYR